MGGRNNYTHTRRLEIFGELVLLHNACTSHTVSQQTDSSTTIFDNELQHHHSVYKNANRSETGLTGTAIRRRRDSVGRYAGLFVYIEKCNKCINKMNQLYTQKYRKHSSYVQFLKGINFLALCVDNATLDFAGFFYLVVYFDVSYIKFIESGRVYFIVNCCYLYLYTTLNHMG